MQTQQATETEHIEGRFVAYENTHPEPERLLAEVIYSATCGGSEGRHLNDPEDPLSPVFQEMVNLYADRHNITAGSLAATLSAYLSMVDSH